MSVQVQQGPVPSNPSAPSLEVNHPESTTRCQKVKGMVWSGWYSYVRRVQDVLLCLPLPCFGGGRASYLNPSALLARINPPPIMLRFADSISSFISILSPHVANLLLPTATATAHSHSLLVVHMPTNAASCLDLVQLIREGPASDRETGNGCCLLTNDHRLTKQHPQPQHRGNSGPQGECIVNLSLIWPSLLACTVRASRRPKSLLALCTMLHACTETPSCVEASFLESLNRSLHGPSACDKASSDLRTSEINNRFYKLYLRWFSNSR